jgi:hypothetical protein
MDFLNLVKTTGALTDTDTASLVTLANPSRQINRLMTLVNNAYNIVWLALHPKNEDAESSVTVNTVSNQEYIDIPFSQVSMVAQNNNTPYRILPWLEYEVNYRRNNGFNQDVALVYGEPNVASIYQKRLYLYPVPDASYPLLVRGNLSFTPLVADADEPLLREDSHLVIQMYAEALELAYQGDQMAQLAREKADAMLRVVRRNMRGHHGMPPSIMSEDEYRLAGLNDAYLY